MGLCGLVSCVVVTGAFGQCSFTVSLWESYRAGQPLVAGELQTPGDAWSFRRDSHTGRC
jgi:hypothetical protein